MPTKPKSTEQDILADARHVVAKVQAHRAAFADADKKKKVKLLEPSLVSRLKKNIARAAAAVGARSSANVAVRRATSSELDARAALFDEVATIRDDIKLTYPGDAALARAFGVCRAIPKDSTPKLLAAADAIASAYDDPAHRAAAKDAGVTPARIRKVAKLAAALADADTAQNVGMASGKRVTANKASLLRAVRADVAHIRKVAQRVFRNEKDVLAEFKSTIARRAVKKRAAKPATA